MLRRSGDLRQKFVYLVVDADDADCWGNEPLYEAGTDRLVGFTTSGGYGHSTQQSLGARSGLLHVATTTCHEPY